MEKMKNDPEIVDFFYKQYLWFMKKHMITDRRPDLRQ